MLRLTLFGGFALHSGTGEAIEITVRKAKGLLAYLALHRGPAPTREHLAALFWAESGEAQARQSLRQALADLRKALGPQEMALLNAGETVALASGALTSDVASFEELLRSPARESLERAVELFRGDLLEGFDAHSEPFDGWLAMERSRWRQAARGAMHELLDELAKAHEDESALRLTLRLFHLEPLDEGVHRRLMELHARLGRPAAALRQYRVCRDLLRRELGIAPDARTEALRAAIADGRMAPIQTESGEASAGDATPTPFHEGPQSQRMHQVAVVAFRLVDAPRLARTFGPEEAHRRLTAFHGCLTPLVAELGGTALRCERGTVVAVFGYPDASGSEVERALRCALDGANLGVPAIDGVAPPAIGVSVGRVVAEAGRDGAPRCTGEPIDVAEDLAQRASPGEVLVERSLQEATRSALQVEATSREHEAAVRVIELLETSQADDAGSFIGRRFELQQLENALALCASEGRGQTILLRGPAGIGKSRLLRELVLRARVQEFRLVEAALLDFGSSARQGLSSQLVRSMLALARDAATHEITAQVAVAVDSGFAPREHLEQLYALLGLSPPSELEGILEAQSPQAREAAQHELLTELAQRQAVVRPLLITVEDIHWAEPAAMRLLAALAEAVYDTRALLLLTSRVEGEPLDPGWRGAMHGAPLHTIDLAPLRNEEAVSLARALGVAEDVARRCVERAGGNPLFLEQLVKLRRDQKDSGDEVPQSVRSLIWARLDRLRAEQRRVIEAAATLGQRLTHEALCFLVDREVLPVDDILRQRLLRPEPGGYAFDHALIRDAVYESLLDARRQALHRRAAEWYRDRDPTLHAQHLERADDPQTVAAYLRAATDSLARSVPQEVLDLTAAALAFLVEKRTADGLGESGETRDHAHRARLLELRGTALLGLGEIAGAEQELRRAHDHAERAHDDRLCVRTLIGQAAALRLRDAGEQALELLARAEELALQKEPSSVDLSEIHYHRGSIFFPQGRLDACLEAHRQALRWAQDAGSVTHQARALSGLADANYQRGLLRTAHACFGDCIEMCREHGLRAIEVANLPMRAGISAYLLDFESCFLDCDEAAVGALQTGNLRAEMLTYNAAAYANNSAGRYEQAHAAAMRSLDLARRLGSSSFQADALAMSGFADLMREASHTALPKLQQAWALCQGAWALSFVGPTILGSLAWATPDPEQREWALERGVSLLEGGTPAHNPLHFYQVAIEVALEQHDFERAEEWASRLEAYTCAEPLPWADLFVALGRARASLLRVGPRRATTSRERATLHSLRERAEAAGLGAAVTLIDRFVRSAALSA